MGYLEVLGGRKGRIGEVGGWEGLQVGFDEVDAGVEHFDGVGFGGQGGDDWLC